jgi:hypothetical protein
VGSYALSLGALSVVALRLPPQAQADIHTRDASLSKRGTVDMQGLTCVIECFGPEPEDGPMNALPSTKDCDALFKQNNVPDGIKPQTFSPNSRTACFPTHPLDYDTTLTNVQQN